MITISFSALSLRPIRLLQIAILQSEQRWKHPPQLPKLILPVKHHALREKTPCASRKNVLRFEGKRLAQAILLSRIMISFSVNGHCPSVQQPPKPSLNHPPFPHISFSQQHATLHLIYHCRCPIHASLSPLSSRYMFASISKQRSNFSTSHFHILSEKYLRTSCLVQNKVVNLQSVKATNFNFRRDGRVVDYSGLENRRAERHRGFESLSLRKQGCKSASYAIYTLF